MAKSISAVVVLLLFIAMAGAEEKRFMSVARLLVGGAEVNPKLENGEPIPDDFYATNIEFLYGAEIHKRAYVRVHSLHPEWEPHPFKIEAARIPNTRILVVRATGEGQQFVQAFLDGLLVEFLNFRRELRFAPTQATHDAITNELLLTEKRTKELEGTIRGGAGSQPASSDVEKAKAELEHQKELFNRLLVAFRQVEEERAKNPEVFSILERASPGIEVRPGSLLNSFGK